jgi:adsorption protein B
MQYLEEVQGMLFDTVVLHDAEDLIHPQALSLINRERAHYDMVQVPVLPLPTGFSDVTHGVYIDEFSEFQTIDMRARQISGSFVPSNGVGTGFSRAVLARLARDTNDQVFDPGSLTEDYEIGVRIHALGYRQCFAPLRQHEGDFVATREYFPRTMKTAIRQRTRWVTGIALQCWARQGWRGPWRTRYWFWRDRKGLLTNPLSVLANVLFIAGMVDWIMSGIFHWPWVFAISNPTLAKLCLVTMLLQCTRTGLRALCVARIFGAATATAVPLRAFHANLMNCGAAMRAVRDYVGARREKRVLAWQKTDHAYPAREALHRQRRNLADVLVGCGYVSEEALQAAQTEVAGENTLDLLLLAQGLISEDDLCKAISMQSGLATARVDPSTINARAIRTLPAHLGKRYGVVPLGVEAGRMLVGSRSVPSETAYEEIGKMSELPVDFQLMTASAYARCADCFERD